MKKILLFLLIAAVLLPACSVKKPEPETPSETPKAEYKKISAEEAAGMMDGEGCIVLDVRTEEEFAAGHIPAALLIPDYELSVRALSELPDKDALILIYCRSGRRSALAAKELVELGYTNVYDFGGIIDWPYEVVYQ